MKETGWLVLAVTLQSIARSLDQTNMAITDFWQRGAGSALAGMAWTGFVCATIRWFEEIRKPPKP